jgi:hypothetical protein
MSPCALSLAEARRLGYDAQVVEKWLAAARVRVDYLGVIDILAINTVEVLAIQCCADSGMAAHRTKCLASRRLALWLAGPGRRFELHGWSTRRSLERTKAGKRSRRLVHHLRREEIRLSDFMPQQALSEAARADSEQPREAIT